jgi:hypothetical protein
MSAVTSFFWARMQSVGSRMLTNESKDLLMWNSLVNEYTNSRD